MEPEVTVIKREVWFLYILECCDGSLYTGITKDLDRRVRTHNEGKASRYTRTRLPVRLRHFEACKNRSQALIREAAVKSLPRDEKQKLIQTS